MSRRLLSARNCLAGLSALLILTLQPGPPGVQAGQPLTPGSLVSHRTVGVHSFRETAHLAAEPDLTCGDVVTGTITLQDDADLGCTGGGVALTVVGPAVLDLNGLQIRCGEGPDGSDVELVGKRAKLTDGRLDICKLFLRGHGRHTVDKIVLDSGSATYAVSVFSDRNLIHSVSSFGEEEGLRIAGDQNSILRSNFITPGSIILQGRTNRIRDTRLVAGAEIGVDGTRYSIRNSEIRSDDTPFVIGGRFNALIGSRSQPLTVMQFFL